MRVGIDASALAHRYGDGRFARNAIRRLVELDGETRYVLHADPQTASSVALPAGAAVREVALRRGAAEGLRVDAARPPGDLARLGVAVARGGYDAFLFPSLVGYVPVPGPPAVVGLHDAHVVRFGAGLLPTRRARAAWRVKQAIATRRAARLFTVSRAARDEIVALTGIPAERLAVATEAPDPVFAPRPPDRVQAALARLGVPAGAQVVAYAAGTQRHKRVGTLIDALAGLRDTAAFAVIAGTRADAAEAELRAAIARHGLADRVALPGFIEDEALACLLSGAAAAVVTSRGEGFGLPAVEAAACGAPVVLSAIPAHRETLGGAARFFAPGDAVALARELRALLEDPEGRQAAGARARQRVAALTWDEPAAVLRDLLVEAAAQRR